MSNKKQEIKVIEEGNLIEGPTPFIKLYIGYRELLSKYLFLRFFIGSIKMIAEFFLITFIIITITFFLIDAAPGKPNISASLPPSTAIAIENKYHLNDPAFKRLFSYIGGLFRGDLGVSLSIFPGTPINQFVWERFGTSAVIGSIALVVTLLVGVPVGVWAGQKITGFSSVVTTLFIAIIISIPSMVFGLMLLLLARSLGLPYIYESTNALTYIAPALSLALAPSITYIKYIRTTMNDEVESQHAKFAHMKGCSRRRFIWRHALKPSLFPIATFFPSAIISVFIGGMFVERIFMISGSGFLFTQAGQTKDIYVMIFLIIVNVITVIISFKLRDLLYLILDPRLRRRG